MDVPRVEIVELDPADRGPATALWHATGLTRPWNDPEADFDRALAGPSSAVLGASAGDDLVATVMVGHDGPGGGCTTWPWPRAGGTGVWGGG